MKKRFRFGIILGALLVMLLAGSYVGMSKILHASTNPPGANCTSVPEAEVDIVITHGKIGNTLDTIAPGICFRFVITNHDSQAYDFIIRQPGGSDRAHSKILAGVNGIAPGQSVRLDYRFAPAPFGTQREFAFLPADQDQVLTTYTVYMAR